VVRNVAPADFDVQQKGGRRMPGQHSFPRGLVVALMTLLLAGLAAPVQASATALEFSTFLGGHDFDLGEDVAVDGAGNMYVLSASESKNFPVTSGAFDKKLDGFDAVVSKLDPTGSELIWSTFLGGSAAECSPGCSLAVDASGAVYVAGTTGSADFPTTPGAFDTTHNGDFDAFVAKLDPSGGALVYGTFLGGAGHDLGFEIAVDDAGAAYVAGGADAGGFPTTPGAFDTTHNGETDAFVAKLDPSGGALVYSTFLGGADEDDAFGGLAIDATGAAYVGGETQSVDFPATAGAFDPTFNGVSDAFVTKLDPSGGALEYSTFLGGGSFEFSLDVQVDAGGAAFVAGDTRSADFPTTPGAFDTTHGGSDEFDGFVAKLNPGGGSLAYSTFLGGAGFERAAGIALPGDGTAVVTGSTGSPEYPVTAGGFDQTLDGVADAFVTTLEAAGSGLVDSTFLGGSSSDVGTAVGLADTGAIHVTGGTLSADFPTTPGAFDTRFNGKGAVEADAFATKLAP
jgi:hypothetical protein